MAQGSEPNKKRERYLKRLRALDTERNTWKAHWRELAEYMKPRAVSFLEDRKPNRGDKRHSKIINNTAGMALRTLSSGMMAGLTSPARPWFKLGLHDKDLEEYAPVREYLDVSVKRMLAVFAGSNLYKGLPSIYSQLGLIGTAAMMEIDDVETLVRFKDFKAGEYFMANGARDVVNTFYWEDARTVQQLVEEFGLDNCSHRVKRHYDKGEYDQYIDVVHAVQPNPDYDPNRLTSEYFRFASCHFEKSGATNEGFLKMSGFESFPVFGPRWERGGSDVYGEAPGHQALGDVKALQLLEKEKATAVQLMTRPPMVAPESLRNKRKTLRPGETTHVDEVAGQGGFRPAFEVRMDIQAISYDIQEHQQRISRAFYEDLFLMLSQSNRREITAREIEERHEEKLLMLGPMLENLENELLGPLIDRTFAKMEDAGFLPEPPQELAEQELEIEYISILAQAQRAVENSRIEMVAGFVTQLAQINPEVIDKLDTDQSVDEYANGIGAPAKIIRSDDAVAEIRDERAKQIAAQQAQEQAAAMAQTAQTLSQTPVGQSDESALDALFGGFAGAGGGPGGLSDGG